MGVSKNKGSSVYERAFENRIVTLLFRKNKKRDYKNCNLLIVRAETEIWTRDPFITSEVLYRWAISAFRWKSVGYKVWKCGFGGNV